MALWYAWARQQMAEVALLPTFSLRLDLPLDGQVVGIVVLARELAGSGRPLSRGLDGAVNAREALERPAQPVASACRVPPCARLAQVGVTLALVAGAVTR